MTLQPGSRPVPNCPDYILIRKLGAGAFGEVWHAHGPGGLDVALKFIPLDPNLRARELRSLEEMKSIRHPNLVSLFATWDTNDCLILAMELCDRTLLDRLAEALGQRLPGIPVKELLSCMSDAANGLDALNAKQVQHRDVKPANLLLLNSGVKVADFGLAKALEQTVATNSGAGTIAYCAPECFQGKITHQSDQYSLAVTYYHLRTGHLLFKGDRAQIMYAHLEAQPDLSRLPQEEAVALARALSKEPGQRWASCRVFVKELIDAHEQVEQERRNDILSYVNRGNACLEKADYENALKEFDEAIRRDPERAESYYFRGYAWYGKNDYDKALKDYDEAIRLDPKYGEAYLYRGDAWHMKNDYDKALKDYDEAIRLDPICASAYLQRGMVWARMNEYEKAISDYDQAIRLDPQDGFTYYHRGMAWYRKNEYEKAIEDFDQAIQLDPMDPSAFPWRGIAWSQKKDFNKAVKNFEEAIRLDPEDAFAYDTFAWLLATCPEEKVRDGKRAIQLATKACELTKGKSGGELGTLAAAYAEAGQFDEAERYQRKALEVCPERHRDVLRKHLELYKQKKPYRQGRSPKHRLRLEVLRERALEDRHSELHVVAEQVAECTRCPELAKSRTQTVFGVGPVEVELCFVGEAPGADEDAQGEPFVGAAGQLLNLIIGACGFKREEVYICNVLKCRPPGNRAPLPTEIGNCRGFLERQLEMIAPRFICALGSVAAQALLQTNTRLTQLRGRLHDYKGIPVICTYHPAYLLPHRHPEKKKDVWEDMKILLTGMGRPIPEV